MVMMTWLADVLRSAQLAVEEVPGWQTRGRGEMAAVKGILVHHTGGALHGDRPSLKLVIEGRKDLAGPLSQLFLTRAGAWVVIAAGRCNHAGAGNWQGVTAGNSNFIGVEAENAGVPADAWPAVQMDAYVRGCAAILKHIGADEVWVAGHREYALPRGRKIDPLFDMFHFREQVAAAMRGDHIPEVQPPAVRPTQLMLRKGDRGQSVLDLQSLLRAWFIKHGDTPVIINTDAVFGPATERVVKLFQAENGLTEDGLVGPKTWAKLQQ